MYYDFHAHFNSLDPDQIDVFAKTCEKNQTRAVMSAGSNDKLSANWEEILKYCRKYPDWMLPGAKIKLWNTPPDVSAVRKLKDMGFVMAKFICPFYAYDHEMYLPVYEELEKLNIPALFHTGIHSVTEEDTKYRIPSLLNMEPVRLDRIARSFPKLKIVAAHLGTSFFRVQAAQMAKVFANVYVDLAGSGAWKGLTPEEVGFYMRNTMNPGDTAYFKKLVVGSDCYVKYPEIQTEAIKHYLNICEQNHLDQETIDGIMGKTVASWLEIND